MIEDFNKTMIEFLTQLNVYNTPNLNFDSFKLMANTSMQLDEYSINCIFHQSIHGFEEHITRKDDVFFLGKESYNSEYEDINIINALKGIWKNVDDKSKENIWNFLNVLLYLDTKINNPKK